MHLGLSLGVKTKNFMKTNEKTIFDSEKIFQKSNISSEELEFLLDLRAKGLINFLLVDIKELFEYSALSIKGTDRLLPTSTMHLHVEILEELKRSPFVLYCRTGNRTGHMLSVLGRMNFEQATHLEDGIVGYKGKTVKNAKPPENI